MSTTHTMKVKDKKIETIVVYQDSMLKKSLEVLFKDHRGSKIVVGLDISNSFFHTSSSPDSLRSKVAVLKLCRGYRCVIIQLLQLKNLSCLANFLDTSDFTFVGVGIKENLGKLRRDYGIECRNGVELGSLAASVKGKPCLGAYGLPDLADEFCRGLMSMKPASVVFSDWDSAKLSKEQIRYATIDAYASFYVGNNLLGGFLFSHYDNDDDNDGGVYCHHDDDGGVGYWD